LVLQNFALDNCSSPKFTFYMKNLALSFAGAALLVLGCQKEPAEQASQASNLRGRAPLSTEVAPSPTSAQSREEVYGCGDFIQGEPTFVQGTYNYPPITLEFENPWGDIASSVTISYSALTVQNRFRIVSPGGYTYFNSGWTSGSGTYTGCIQNGSQLLVSARSVPRALDRWSVSISQCLSCL
jgi:hypothetical protein